MARIPTGLNGPRPRVPDDDLIVPDAPTMGEAVGEGLADFGGRVAELGQRLGQAEQESKLATFQTEMLQGIAQAEQAAAEAEPGRQADVFDETVEPLEQRIAELDDPRVQERAENMLARRVATRRPRMLRLQAQRLSEQAANQSQNLSDTLVAQGAIQSSGDEGERQQAFTGYEEHLQGRVEAGTLREEQAPELMREFRSRYYATELNNLSRQDPEAAAALVESDQVQNALSGSQVRVFRQMAERNERRVAGRNRATFMGQFANDLNEIMLADEFDAEQLQNRTEAFVEQAGRLREPPTQEDMLELFEPHLEAASNDPEQGLQKLAALEAALPETAEAANAVTKARDRLSSNMERQEQVESQADLLLRAASGEEVGRLPDSPDAVDEFYSRARQHQGLPEIAGFLAENDLPMPDAALSELNGAFSPAGGFDFDSGVATLRAIRERDPDRFDAVVSGMADSRLGESADTALVRAAVAGSEGLVPGTERFEERLSVLQSPAGRGAVEQAADLMPGGENDQFAGTFTSTDISDLLESGGLEADRVTMSMRQRFTDRFRYELARSSVQRDRPAEEVALEAGDRAGRAVAASMTNLRPGRMPVSVEKLEGLSANGRDALRQAMNAAEGRFDPGLLSLEGEAREDLMIREGERIMVPVVKDGNLLGGVLFNATNHTSQMIAPENDRFAILRQRFEQQDRLSRSIFGGEGASGGADGSADRAEMDPLAPKPDQQGKPLVRFEDARRGIWRRAQQQFVQTQGREPDGDSADDRELLNTLFERIAREKGWERIVPKGSEPGGSR